MSLWQSWCRTFRGQHDLLSWIWISLVPGSEEMVAVSFIPWRNSFHRVHTWNGERQSWQTWSKLSRQRRRGSCTWTEPTRA
eukprot:2975067-Rhodomonas_salina.1